MNRLELLKGNKEWKENLLKEQPDFFTTQKVQTPHYLWIGCSDSRFSPNIITNTQLGDLFVYRNIGNQIHDHDEALMSVLEFALFQLKIKSIILAGHYGCGAIESCCKNQSYSPRLDEWLSPLKDFCQTELKNYAQTEDTSPDILKDLCRKNVTQQIKKLKDLPIVQECTEKYFQPEIFGLIYDVYTGSLEGIEKL